MLAHLNFWQAHVAFVTLFIQLFHKRASETHLQNARSSTWNSVLISSRRKRSDSGAQIAVSSARAGSCANFRPNQSANAQKQGNAPADATSVRTGTWQQRRGRCAARIQQADSQAETTPKSASSVCGLDVEHATFFTHPVSVVDVKSEPLDEQRHQPQVALGALRVQRDSILQLPQSVHNLCKAKRTRSISSLDEGSALFSRKNW